MSCRSRWLAPALSLSLVACVVETPATLPSRVETQAVVKTNASVTPAPGSSLTPALQTPAPAAAGQLAGLVLAPAGFASNPGMDLVAAGGLNAIAQGKLVAAGGLNFRLPAARKLLSFSQEIVAGAPVQLFDAQNKAVTDVVLTDQAGNYLIPKMPAPGGPFVLKLGVKGPGGAAVVREALLHPNETLRGDVDLASTLVTAAVLARSGGKLAGVRVRDAKRATSFVASGIQEEALPDLTDLQAMANVVLALAKTSQELRNSLLALAGEAVPTPSPGGTAAPSAAPSAGASGTPGPAGSGSPTPSSTPTPKPTAKPFATPPPLKGPELYTRVRLYVGTDREGSADGDAAKAQFKTPKGISFDAAGRLYVADLGNGSLRMVGTDGTVETVLGGAVRDADNKEAPWKSPYDVVSDAAGTICWVADIGNKKLYAVSHLNGKTARATVLAGGATGFAEGIGAAAGFDYPGGLASDGRGTLFVADAKPFSSDLGARILQVDAATGAVKLLAGGNTRGVADGKGLTEARFRQPVGLAVRMVGTTREVWVADAEAGNIRRIVERVNDEPLVTTPIGPSEPNAGPEDARVYGHRDALPLTDSKFRKPGRMVFSPDGDLFVIDTYNQYVRWVRFKGGEPAEIRTLAPANVATGGGTSPFKIATMAGIAFGPTTGTLFLSQFGLFRISEIK
jgi:hypothetical protein